VAKPVSSVCRWRESFDDNDLKVRHPGTQGDCLLVALRVMLELSLFGPDQTLRQAGRPKGVRTTAINQITGPPTDPALSSMTPGATIANRKVKLPKAFIRY
jgi:hypothetical protein